MKRTLMVLALMAIMFGMAAATETRVATFGPSSMFINDYTDIYFLPAAALSYPRLIAVEMGDTFPIYNDYYWPKGSAAMLFSNAEQTFGVVGIDINHAIVGSEFFNAAINSINTSNAIPAINPGLYPQYNLMIPAPDNRFHVFYARKLNNLDLGLHIGWAGSAASQDYNDTVIATSTTKAEGSATIWDINGNVLMNANETTSAELAFSLKMESFSSKVDYTWPTPPQDGATIESDGGMGMDVALRAYYGMADNLSLIPVIQFNNNSIGYKTSYVDTTIHPTGGKTANLGFGGGFGANYKPAENVMLAGGLLIGYSKTTTEDTMGVFSGVADYKLMEEGSFMFPAFCAGLEVEMLKWLTLRAGAAKMLQSNSYKYEDNVYPMGVVEGTYTTAPYFYAFGLGLKFKKLAIDLKLNNNVPYSLGYFISGINNTANNANAIGSVNGGTQPVTSVGMTYTF